MVIDIKRKTVFITGGSGGLGEAIAKIIVQQGAHINLLANNPVTLKAAKEEVQVSCRHDDQVVDTAPVDMSDATQVDKTFRSQQRVADQMYCIAGGNHAESGFLVDLRVDQLESCMNNNYFSSAYAANSMLDIWTEHDEVTPRPLRPAPLPIRMSDCTQVGQKVHFAWKQKPSSTTAAKCAVRALADTLQMGLLRYDCQNSKYSAHCSFPADFVSPGFVKEQSTKTPLAKRIQGVDLPLSQLEAKFPSSEEMAALTVEAVHKGDFIMCDGSSVASLLFTGMLGPSPKGGWGVLDGLSSLFVNLIVWPTVRWRWEAMTKADGRTMKKRQDGPFRQQL